MGGPHGSLPSQVENSAKQSFQPQPLPPDARVFFLMTKTSSFSTRARHAQRRPKRKPDAKRQPVKLAGHSGTAIQDTFVPVFPNLTTRQLRYNDYGTVDITSGALGSHVFTLSGLYDPNITGTGHQPMGFDQMMTFYEHYHVLRCKVKVTFMCRSSAGHGQVALKVTPDTALPASGTDLVEEGRAITDSVGGDNFQAQGTRTLGMVVDVPGVNGLNRANFLADPDLRGTISSNPAEQTYLQICLWSPSLDTMTVEWNLVLEYTAVFTEPRNLSASFAALRIQTQPKQPTMRCVPSELKTDSATSLSSVFASQRR